MSLSYLTYKINLRIFLSILLIQSCQTKSHLLSQALSPNSLQAYLVQDLNSGRVLTQKSAQQAFIPASTLKIVTALAALAELGPAYRFETQLLQNKNTLVLRFGGDPTLTQFDLDRLFNTLKTKAVKPFDNLIVEIGVDRFPATAPTRMVEDLAFCYGAPVNYAIINQNCHILDNHHRAVPETSLQAHIRSQIKAVLHRRAIQIKALKLSKNITPGSWSQVASHTSQPLSIILNEAMKTSNNVIFDHLFLELASQAHPPLVSWDEAGKHLVALINKHYQVDLSQAVIKDGSGLARNNLITAQQLMALIQAASRYPQIWPEFLTSLPSAGLDGTLSQRFKRPVQRDMSLRAKTGSMGQVSALAGVKLGPGTQSWAFVIFANHFVDEAQKQRTLEESLCNIWFFSN